MTYTTEQLTKIEDMASLYMTISDIAVILGVEVSRLREDVADVRSEAHIHYVRGKATSTLQLRAQEMQLAKMGSPLALANVRSNLLDMEDDE